MHLFLLFRFVIFQINTRTYFEYQKYASVTKIHSPRQSEASLQIVLSLHTDMPPRDVQRLKLLI